MIEKIRDLMADLEEDDLMDAVKEEVEKGTDKMEIIDSLSAGLGIVGERFSAKEYFIAELMYSAELFDAAQELLGKSESSEAKYGNYVLGTVYTDLHDIGKNIVNSVLSSNGFNVIDLGIDVQPETFVEAIKKYDPKVVGMSCLLTTSFDPLKNCIAAIRDAGLDKGRLLMVGGSPVDEEVRKYVNADVRTGDAMECFAVARKFVEEHALD